MTLQAAKAFEAGVEAMPDLEVVGGPEMCNVAFKSRTKAVDVYKVPMDADRLLSLPPIAAHPSAPSMLRQSLLVCLSAIAILLKFHSIHCSSVCLLCARGSEMIVTTPITKNATADQRPHEPTRVAPEPAAAPACGPHVLHGAARGRRARPAQGAHATSP